MMIGVCGYGYTGSGAVIDLLKEYEGLNRIDTKGEFEFTVPYAPGGLLSLEYNLTKAPSKHLSGDDAIYRFIKMTNWISKSMNRITNNRFSKINDEYIKSLVQVEYSCHCYRTYAGNLFSSFFEKSVSFAQARLEKTFKRYIPLHREGKRYISVYPDEFLEKTKKYINDILIAAGLTDNGNEIVLDQPFPPNDPESVFHFFDNPRAVVVNRDPRDLYVLVKHLIYANAKFIPHDTVEDFVRYYRAVTQCNKHENSGKVLRISFEELVYEYDNTVKKIENFLKLDKHISPQKYFDPQKSVQNTYMMDLFPEDKEDIAYIEKELPKFLFPFEKYKKPESRDDISGVLA